ncbi:hypothetical protein L1F34_001593 [Mammaliicoccus lentus]
MDENNKKTLNNIIGWSIDGFCLLYSIVNGFGGL